MYANLPALPPSPRPSGNGHVATRLPAPDTDRSLGLLPPQPQPLVDRRWEVDEIRGMLLQDDVRLVTLTGPGGVGKTRLAVAVAEELRHRFPDGVAFVDLAPLGDPRLVLPTLARALNVRAGGEEPLLKAVQRTLQGRELLLVLDNIEHLLGAVAEVETLLAACSLLKVLATSRERLGLRWEHEFPLMPLALPPSGDPLTPESLTEVPSVALFVRLAQTIRPDFALSAANAGAVTEICRRLDGIPLAIELAAARLKALTPAQIAARLDDRFRLLTTGSRTALPRHQTLRGALDWSYELLSEPERVLLRRLAVFPGGWTIEAAEQVCGDREQGRTVEPDGHSLVTVRSDDVLDLLTDLVDKSLVLAEEHDGAARYRLLETIRQYAWERLAAREQAEVLRRHAEHYLALAEEAEPYLRGPEQGQWLERLEAEHNNLRAALDWLIARDPELGLRLGAALWRFWDMRGYLSEGREQLTALLTRATTRRHSTAWVLHGLGTFARKQGDFDVACRLHEEGLAICRRLDDRAGAAHQLNSLALAKKEQGELDTARALASESLTIMREGGDDWGASMVLNNLGLIIKDSGDVAAAAPLEEESLAIKRQLGDRWGIGYSLRNLGEAARLQGDHDAAVAWFGEALRLAFRLGDRRIVASCVHGLGGVAVARGAVDGAARLFGAAAALRDAIGLRLSEQRRAEEDQPVDTARAALGEEAFAALWAEGHAMPFDAAVAYALSMAESSAIAAEPVPSGDAGPLSAREREVAILLAQGLTNRQIADELVVATSTVDRHVVNILRKLDLTSRARVAAWAVEHGLTAASR